MKRSCMVSILALCATTLVGASALAVPCRDETTRARIIAIADVHGGLPQFLAILGKTGLIDAKGSWSGDCTTFVQVGDLIDRGPDDRAVLDLMIRLQKEAPERGGKVVPVLGNHEVMNVLGDLRYVSAQSYASHVEKGSEQRRAAALKDQIRYSKRRARLLKQEPPVMDQEWIDAWYRSHPLGFLEHRKAFGSSGPYGKWIRAGMTVARVDRTLFLHGGLSPTIPGPVKSINDRVRKELQLFDQYIDYLESKQVILPFFTLSEVTEAVDQELRSMQASPATSGSQTSQKHRNRLADFLKYASWFSVHPKGPLWFRGYAQWSEEEGSPQVDLLTERFDVDRIVVGHTPDLTTGVRSRFQQRIFLIDAGLYNDYYRGGRPSALEIRQGEVRIISVDYDASGPRELDTGG